MRRWAGLLLVCEMTCGRCEHLDEYVRFRTRGELFRAVGTVRQALTDGDIEEVDAGPMKGAIPFGDLSEVGPLDDVHNRISCKSFKRMHPFFTAFGLLSRQPSEFRWR